MAISYAMPASIVTGLNATAVKPVDDNKVGYTVAEKSGGFWGVLDSVGETVGSAFGTVVNAYAQKEAGKINRGAETTVDSRGDVSDQVLNGQATAQKQSVLTEYKTPLLIVGGLLVALIAYKAVK